VSADTLAIIVRMPLTEGDIAMWKKILLLAALGIVAAVLPGSPASAQATRTWVSGVGDDANPCSRTAPCKTFAGAISKTAAGGEIDVLDPGGFGGLTITKSITIDGGGGQTGSVLVGNTVGITVAAAATDVVILRRVEFQGVLGNGSGSAGPPGTIGINFISGAVLNVDQCAIIGFKTAGISATTSGTSQLYVTNTYITNTPTGISLAPSGALTGVINNTSIFNVSASVIASSGSGGPNFVITNSSISSNLSSGTGVLAGTPSTRFNVDASSVSHNNIGFSATASGAIIRASNNDVYDDNTNFSISGGASIISTGNNRLVTNGSPPSGSINQQ
jgi:hypothetical protein